MNHSTHVATAVLVVAAVFVMSACSGGSPTTGTAPAESGLPTNSASPTPTLSPADKVFAADDLPAIILTPAQMANWQVATRPDLTGPFTATSNTTSQMTPPPALSLKSGYRQTIGNPGAPGINTLQTVLEVFESPAAARAAVGPTITGYESAGYTQAVDVRQVRLGSDVAARQLAPGASRPGIAIVWRSGNLLLIQVGGGDHEVTLDAAIKWAQLVQANTDARGRS